MWHPQHVALLHSNICVRNYLRCLCGNFPEQYWNWTIGNLHCDSSHCNAETLCVFSGLDKSLTKGEKMMESPCKKFMNSDRIFRGNLRKKKDFIVANLSVRLSSLRLSSLHLCVLAREVTSTLNWIHNKFTTVDQNVTWMLLQQQLHEFVVFVTLYWRYIDGQL